MDDWQKGKGKNGDVLNGGNASAEKSQDKGYGDYKQKQKQEEASIEFYGAGYKGMNETKSSGSSHQNHEERKEYVGDKAFSEKGIGRVGRRFALNSDSIRRLSKNKTKITDKIQEYFSDNGIADAKSFFAETTEKESHRFLSAENSLTNKAIKMDNYEFFLNNSYQIKTNLAKTLLAKMDLDRDIKGTLSDLLEKDGKWESAEPEIVFQELKNRLRNSGHAHHKEYAVILKAFGHIEDIEREQKAFVDKRQSTAIKSLGGFSTQIASIVEMPESNDEVSQKRTFALLSQFFADQESHPLAGEYKAKDTDTLHDLITKRLKFLKSTEDGTENKDANYPDYLDDLDEKLLENITLSNQNPKILEEKVRAFEKSKKSFIEEHNQSLSASTEILDRFNFRSNHYPVTALARWADEEYLVNNFVEPATREAISVKEIDESMTLAIRDVLGYKEELTDDAIENIKENLKRTVMQSKDKIESIYNIGKDTADTQRAYRMYESQHYHEDAHNILRDAMYLSLFKEGMFAPEDADGEKKSVYDEFYNESREKEIVASILDKDIQDLRPNINKVTDLYNMISAVNKTASATIDDRSFDALLDSTLFTDNSLFKDDIEAIRSYGKDLAKVSEQIKEKDIYGTPEDHELRDAIQEMVYIENADRIIDKIHRKGTLAQKAGFLFLQNNKAIHNLEVCMQGARNPTTKHETVPSLSKACFQKMKDELEQQAKEANRLISNPQSAMLGLSFIGALVMFASVHASSEKDKIENLIKKMNFEIAEESSYIETSADKLQKSARMMNVEAEKLGIGSQIVKDGFKDKLIDEAELEHTIRDIVKTSDKSLPDNIILGDESLLNEMIRKESGGGSPIAERAKDESMRDKVQLAEMRSSLETKQIEHLISKGESQELREISENILAYETYLNENTSSVDIDEVVAVRMKSQKEMRKLEELKSTILERQKEQELPESLQVYASRIEEIEERIKQNAVLIASEESLKSGIKDSLLSRIERPVIGSTINSIIGDGSRIVFNLGDLKLDEEDTYEEKSRKAEERNVLIASLGSYRDALNTKLLDLEAEPLSKEATEKYIKETARIDSIMPLLHREALADSYNVGETIRGYVYDKFHFKIEDSMVDKIKREGLTPENTNLIMEQAKNLAGSMSLSDHKKNVLHRGLGRMQKAQNILNPKNGKISIDEGSGFLSSFLKNFNNSTGNGLGKLVQRTNNFYSTSSVSMDGNAYVNGGKGLIGMFLFRLEEAEKARDYEKMDKLSKSLDKLSADGYIPNEQKEDLLGKLNKQSNDLTGVNSYLTDAKLKANRKPSTYRSSKEARKGVAP